MGIRGVFLGSFLTLFFLAAAPLLAVTELEDKILKESKSARASDVTELEDRIVEDSKSPTISVSTVLEDQILGPEAQHLWNAHRLSLPFTPYSRANEDRLKLRQTQGLSIGIGYYSQIYHQDAKVNEWNSYWHWGTVALVIPFLGFGLEYNFENGMYIGLGTIFIIPYPYFGFSFH